MFGDKIILTAREVSKVLGISPHRVRQLIKKRLMPGLRENFRWKVPARSFERYLNRMADRADQRTINERWLNPRQVGTLLGMSMRRARRLMKSGVLPGAKVGQYWLVPETGLRSYIADLSERALANANARAIGDLRARYRGNFRRRGR